jgi:hypothetical protein
MGRLVGKRTVETAIDIASGSIPIYNSVYRVWDTINLGEVTGSVFPFTGSAVISGSLTVSGTTNLIGDTGTTMMTMNADTMVFTGSFITTGSVVNTGSLSVLGNINATSITSSLLGTSSYANNSLSSSYAISASYLIGAPTTSSQAFTASYVSGSNVDGTVSSSYTASIADNAYTASYISGSNVKGTVSSSYTASIADNAYTASFVLNAVSASYATQALTASNALTASSADNLLIRNGLSGSNAVFTGTITAQSLIVQTVSSSVIYSTGSNKFGNELSNTQELTGSTGVTGSLTVNNIPVVLENQTGSMSVATSSFAFTASYVENAQTASYVVNALTASYVQNAISSSQAANAYTASYVENAQTASYVLNAVSSSYSTQALTASNANTASYVQNAQTASYVLNAFTASYISGSNVKGTVSSSYTASIADNAFTASYVESAQTASYVLNAFTASYISGSNVKGTVSSSFTASLADNATSASFALTASYLLNFPTTASHAVSASYAATASYVLNAFTASYINGDGVNGTVSSSYTASISDNAYTASYVENAQTASYVSGSDVKGTVSSSFTASLADNATSASFAVTASYLLNLPATASHAVSASYAATASSADNFYVRNILSGSDALFTGTITAQTIHVQTISSSVVFSTGSNKLGSLQSDIQQLTGSVGITGSLKSVGSAIFGDGTSTANGEYAFAFGSNNQANGNYSIAHGGNSIAGGVAAHAEGSTTQANGNWSHTEGNSTVVSAGYGHAEGISTTVGTNGDYAHAEGESTLANGRASHAEGLDTAAIGSNSHAEGQGTIASGSYQHAEGRFNLKGNTTSLLVVGNGTDNNNRSDIVRVNPTNVQITGSLTVTSGITGSLEGTAATASYVVNALSASYVVNALSASLAATASSADNFTVRGTLTAQTIIAQTVTSSTEFVTGSTKFGSLLSNTHQFTGSVSITGSLTMVNSNITMPYDNTAFIIGNNNDVGIVKKLGAGGFLAFGNVNDFVVSQASGSSNVFPSNTFIQKLSINASTGVLTNSNGITAGQAGADNFGIEVFNELAMIKKSGGGAFIAYPANRDFFIAQSTANSVAASNTFNRRLTIDQTSGHVLINTVVNNGFRTAIYGTGSPSGSLLVSGTSVFSGSVASTLGFTGSLLGTASYAATALTASNAITASYISGSNVIGTVSSSYTASIANNAYTASYVINAITSSYVNTASYALDSNLLDGKDSQAFASTGSNIYSGSQTIYSGFRLYTDAVENYSGNTLNLFGDVKFNGNDNSVANNLSVTGSLNAPNITGSILGTASFANSALSASYALNSTSGSYAFSASYALNSTSASNAISSSYAVNALSASFALTASYARNIIISGTISNVDYIDFNTGSATPTWKSGRVFWDNTDGCLAVYNAEADTTLQVGQENWTRVRNNTGTTITNGTVVRIIGAQGDVPTVERAQSIAKSGSVNQETQILGVATHNIEDNSFGYVTTQGLVRGLNTNAFTDGASLFVGTGSAGALQSVPPRAPFEIIPVGVCVKASPGGSGIIYVAVQQPIDFSDLSSVLVTGSYGYGDLWTYQPSGSLGVWSHTNQLSGSYGITGSLGVTGAITGSLLGTASYAQNANLLDGRDSTTFAGTGSNYFSGSQVISGSLIVSGSSVILNNLTVLGTASYNNVTASSLVVLDNWIYVTTTSSFGRFGGLKVYDYEGSGDTASFAWDTTADRWLEIAPAHDTYSSSLFMMGPKNTGSLGSEIGLTSNFIPKAEDDHHLIDSAISDNGSTVNIGRNSQIIGSLNVSQGITGSLLGSSSFAQRAISASYAAYADAVGTIVSGAIVTTGSNNFVGNQVISGSLTVTQNLTVFGTASFTYVTASQIDVSASFISVNVFEPYQRFGGLKVYDSGSSNATASFAWDSLKNHWIYQDVQTTGSSGGIFIVGPINTGSIGDERHLTAGRIPKAVGGDHIDDSVISDISGSIGISGSVAVTGSLMVQQTLYANSNSGLLSSGLQTVSINGTGSFTSAFCNYTVISGSNARAGQFIAVWNGTTIRYSDNSTTDVGSTLGVNLTASLSGNNVLVTTVLPSNNWTVKTSVNLL